MWLRPAWASANRADRVEDWVNEALSFRTAERVAGRGRVAGVYAAWMPRPSLHACPEVSKGTDLRRPPRHVTGLRRAPLGAATRRTRLHDSPAAAPSGRARGPLAFHLGTELLAQ